MNIGPDCWRREGFLSLVSHLPPKRLPALRGWTLKTTHWQKIKADGYSHRIFPT
ncbi:MAG: hypothetical protein CM1200mP28_06470 [Deltaproteobacteria bacterium]|nr:MAG: hypothetical protein CM1200mP28_06470 [Deltaproteobacteria bacterium]